MKWEEFVKITNKLPVIDAEILLAGVSDSMPIKVQVSRWTKSGKLIQLRRGYYLLSDEYRKVDVYEPHVASVLEKPSYISLEKAFEYYGLIPESVNVYTSVTTKRQGRFVSAAGVFEYRHIQPSLFWGYDTVIFNKQPAFFAYPEKALLDYFYLKGLTISLNYLEELRLQNVDKINIKKLFEFAARFKKPGIMKAVETVNKYINNYKREEKSL
jgi:predicted transcriptional regulator of viral defense system